MNPEVIDAGMLQSEIGGRKPSFSTLRLKTLRKRQRENLELNGRESLERRIVLSSSPPRVFLQINAVCNADCIFCSKGYDYPLFRLEDYVERYGRELDSVLRGAQELVLTGSGEFLGLPDSGKILEHFNRNFPHVDKYIATNASHLNPGLCQKIAGAESRYTLQLSLHASDPQTHKLMMRYDAFERVRENIAGLMELRKNTGNPRVYFMFVMTTLNVENLPGFVRFAKEMGADKVLAGYFYIYESQQKYLSLYFKQDLANRMMEEARKAAEEVEIPIQLPHRFGQNPTAVPKPDFCPEPWSQIMIHSDGGVLPCDVYGGFDENLSRKGFWEIWNGPAYRQMRKALREGAGCLATCPRHNPVGVDDWRAHVIHRPKEEKQIVKEYQEALRKP